MLPNHTIHEKNIMDILNDSNVRAIQRTWGHNQQSHGLSGHQKVRTEEKSVHNPIAITNLTK